MTSTGGKIRIGISGWTYAPWRGVFYPKKLPQKKELSFAAERFGTVEVNGTFYGLQRPQSFAHWANETPEDFVFAIKGSRYISHMLKLKDVEIPLANFFASGPLRLGPKLGPFLWQFPERMKFDPERFERFLDLLPRDTEGAARLARGHDARLEGRAYTDPGVPRPLRHAIEIRNASFCTEGFISLLRRYKVALVCADTPDWPLLMDLTADFVYCRLHGSEQLYASGYDEAALDRWARRIQAWAGGREPADANRVLEPTQPRRGGRDVYVYFDNDAKVHAPFDAAALAARLGIETGLEGKGAGAEKKSRGSRLRRAGAGKAEPVRAAYKP